MKIFFDESGNTGCIIPNKNGAFYNDKQRFFILCGVICKDDADEEHLKRKYASFKEKYHISGEIKGSDMMKRENNGMLIDFIENMLDDIHFIICCYDKIYYLASLINSYFFPRSMMQEEPYFYFTQASALTQEDISLFLKYCECNAIGTEEASLEFCKFITEFPFKKIDKECNGYLEMAKLALQNGEAFDFPLPLGSYCKYDYTNLINITALGETLLVVKESYQLKAKDIFVIHDRIKEFEDEFIDSFQKTGFDLHFCDSKDEELLQYADNVASIFRKCCTETVELFRRSNQWDQDKKWFPSLYSKILRKISYINVKWDTAISDQVLPLCVEEMFSDNFPNKLRNNSVFSQLFFRYKEVIIKNVISLNYDVEL